MSERHYRKPRCPRNTTPAVATMVMAWVVMLVAAFRDQPAWAIVGAAFYVTAYLGGGEQ